MKISKNSWHYKLLRFFDFNIVEQLEYTSVSLCRYFWNVVGAILLVPLAIIVLVFAVALLLFFLFAAVVAPLSYLSQAYFNVGWDIASEFGSNSIWVVLVLLVYGGITDTVDGKMELVPNWMSRGTKVRSKAPSTPNLLVEWVKAKKNKVCPLVEVSDD